MNDTEYKLTGETYRFEVKCNRNEQESESRKLPLGFG